jgi:hypothetical protein
MMNHSKGNIKIENTSSVEEKILISAFHDSETLKEQIRKTTDHYAKKGWNLTNISSQGGFVFLKFSGLKSA